MAKALCVKPCFQDRLIEVGEEVDFSSIPYASRNCFTIGGTLISEIEDFSEDMFLPPRTKGDVKGVIKTIKGEVKDAKKKLEVETAKNTDLTAENDTLKIELAKLEAKLAAAAGTAPAEEVNEEVEEETEIVADSNVPDNGLKASDGMF